MNTIKYRALAKDGTWRYGEYPHFAPEMSNTHYPMDVFWNSFLASFQRETLGQWSGLLDKQGKEIYEGDVLQLSYGTHLVKIDIQHGLRTMWGKDNFARSYALDGKIIGNRWENPELLEVSND